MPSFICCDDKKKKEGTTYVTQGKINRMCKYFKNKNITLREEHNCSLPEFNHVFTKSGKFTSFELKTLCVDGKEPCEYQILFTFSDGSKHESEIPSDAWFEDLGKIKWCNSGPYCYLVLEYKPSLIGSIRKLFNH